MKVKTMILVLACLSACTVSVFALDGKKDNVEIEGTFTDHDGTPLAYAQVFLYDSGQKQIDTVLSAGDGSFRFSGLLPGVYYICCVRDGEPTVWYGGSSMEPIVVGSSGVSVEIVALK